MISILHLVCDNYDTALQWLFIYFIVFPACDVPGVVLQIAYSASHDFICRVLPCLFRSPCMHASKG